MKAFLLCQSPFSSIELVNLGYLPSLISMLKDDSGQMHSDCPGIVSIYRRHNYIYLLRFKVLMEPIIIVVIKLMGTAISGQWDLRDTGTTRDYDTLARSLGWLSGSDPGWESHKNVTFSPVGHAWLPKWLRPVTAKRANNQGENVHISHSTTPIVLILVSRDS